MGGTQASLSPSSLPPSRLPFAPDRKGTRTLLLLLHTHTQPMPKKGLRVTLLLWLREIKREEREKVLPVSRLASHLSRGRRDEKGEELLTLF